MSNFSLRPSTIKKSEATKERLKLREETKKCKRNSKVRGGLRSNEERSYSVGANQSKENTVREETDSSNDDGGDNPHFYWDHAGDIDSPEKVETPVFPNLTSTESATWSTRVNQFFPSDCINTPFRDPVCRTACHIQN